MEWVKKNLILLLIGVIGVIVAFLIIPMSVNLLIGSTFNPTPFKLNGTTSDWHSFWSVYLGALIGATVPFIILYKTIKNNKAENNENRKLQLNTIAYQTQMQWINTLKNAIQQITEAFSILWLDEIYLICKETNDSNSYNNYHLILEKLKQISDRVNRATDNLRLTIIGKNDNTEVELANRFELLRERFCDLISDLSALTLISFHNGTDDYLMDQFEKALDEHKSKCTTIEEDSHRLWSIAAKHQNLLKKNRTVIVEDLIKCYHSKFIYDWCKQFIEYETNKAVIILNGTEQDK